MAALPCAPPCTVVLNCRAYVLAEKIYCRRRAAPGSAAESAPQILPAVVNASSTNVKALLRRRGSGRPVASNAEKGPYIDMKCRITLDYRDPSVTVPGDERTYYSSDAGTRHYARAFRSAAARCVLAWCPAQGPAAQRADPRSDKRTFQPARRFVFPLRLSGTRASIRQDGARRRRLRDRETDARDRLRAHRAANDQTCKNASTEPTDHDCRPSLKNSHGVEPDV